MDKKQELRTQKDGGSLSALHQDQEFEFVILRKNDTGNLWYAGLEIILVLMGSGTLYELDGTSVYSVKEGDIFVINSFCMRQLDLEDGASAIALRISSSFITAISPETANLYINCKSFLHAQDRQENFDILRRDFARAFSAYYKNESGRSVYLRTKISVLLDDLIRCFMEDAPQLRNESGRERLRLAIEYIQANFRENITLDDLAERTFLSKTYISHSFQKYLGISFTGYLTMVRLAHAQTLLGGKNTVTDIAYESGFSSANAMIKAFKHYRGSTPGAYRRRIESEKEMNREASCMAEIGFSNVFASLLKYMDEFKEKPDLKTARHYVDAGNYFWNAGIFVWNVKTIEEAIRRYAPGIAEVFDRIYPEFYTEREKETIEELFPACESISIDYAVMEKAERIYVLPAEFGWSDLGSWGSLHSLLPKDERNNAVVGENVRMYECNNCIVHTPHLKQAVIQGLDGYIIAEKEGTLLICRLAEEQRIKEFSKI